MNQDHIRNFAIIAHIDHGKSTLADRLLEMTGTVAKRDMQEQLLDSNPIERERGITIKLAPVRMKYQGYILNLIDTPGHVDFSYEVSRSLAACEGAILVVDATQGVQAQTIANLRQATEHKLKIIPVINKIDLPNARIDEVRSELGELGFKDEEIIEISAKTGQNVDAVLKAIAQRIPIPLGVSDKVLRALVFSSQYDSHKGVVVFVRVVDGNIQFDPNLRLTFLASGAQVTPIEVGYFTPRMTSGQALLTGEVGYIATGLKDARLAKVGDTITLSGEKAEALHGYKEPKPMVFLGLYPTSSADISAARDAMEKLRLSDSAFTFRPTSSLALGNGFHCGFLGLLHAEIVQERLSREFGLNMIATAPSVEYLVKLASRRGAEVGTHFLRPPPSLSPSISSRPSAIGVAHSKNAHLPAPLKQFNNVAMQQFISIQSAAEFPDPTLIDEVREPIMQVKVYTPKQYVGAVMQLSQEKRGAFVDLIYQAEQAEFTYLMPLSEMIIDFFDRLKSVTEGYASLDYEFFDYQAASVVKVDILVNKEKVDALAFLVVRDQAHARSIQITDRLASVIPRAQFEIPVQAAIGGKIVARSDVKAFRKDVIQKLYGGDRTRKDKLLEAQKKGKARMKLVGRVGIPQSAFFEVLKRV
ncbi:elongation factor 4 [Candidatus Gottesmanbacteria bacterium]|nr:elongation factor 4 [Candidatus Gottesmanbacteria bacterium]